MDYTFTGVNEQSAPLAPMHAMQFGQTLQRVLQRVAYADPTHGPTLLAKFDLSDGYYRVPLSPEACLELAVVLPPPFRTATPDRYTSCPANGMEAEPPILLCLYGNLDRLGQ